MDQLKITFVNVGNGDAALIACPRAGGWFYMVIDGGSGETSEYEGSRTGRISMVQFLEEMGIDHLDVAVCTHIHEDHVCGLLNVVERWTPKELWQSYPLGLQDWIYPVEPEEDTDIAQRKCVKAMNAYRRICELVKDRGGVIRRLGQGSESLMPCEGLLVEPLAPAFELSANRAEYMKRFFEKKTSERWQELIRLEGFLNNTSLMLMLTWGGKKLLFPGDMEASGYAGLTESIKAEIFKVGHHGQGNCLTPELLAAIAPRYAVITASSDRRYEGAAPQILKLLDDFGTRLYFTDTPHVSPYTDDLTPHRGVQLSVSADGEVEIGYLPIIIREEPFERRRYDI